MLLPGDVIAVCASEVKFGRVDISVNKTDIAYNIGNNIWFSVGRSGGKWIAEPLTVNDTSKSVKISILDMELLNGYPWHFDAEIQTGNKTEVYTLREADRYLKCGVFENKRFRVAGGFAPTLLIGLAGDVGSGKTLFSKAIRTGRAAEALQAYFKDSISMDCTGDLQPRPERSVLGTFDGSRIRMGKTDIILVDLAGELTQPSGQGPFDQVPDTPVADRILADSVFRSCRSFDGVFLFVKGRTLFGNDPYAYRIGSACARFLDKLGRKLMKAVVITEGDLVQARLKAGESLLRNAHLTAGSPLFTPCTSMEDVYRHAALCHSLFREVSAMDIQSPAFLVSSVLEAKCTPTQIDCSKALNVEVPLAWMASRLTHLTLREEDDA